MNNISCPQISFDFTSKFLPPVYILVFIIGLTANVIGLKSLLQNWSKQKIINVFALNLGLADILYLLTLPFWMVYYIYSETWIFGEIFCKVTRFCFNMNLYGSIGFLTCISVSRYGHSSSGSCDGTTDCDSDYLTYSMGWTVTGFCLPFLVTVGCYTHVIVTLCGSRSTNHQLKSLKLLLVLILLFAVCYIPDHILKNLNLWVRVLTKKKQCYSWFNMVYMAHQVGRGLVSLNPALNPLVYLHVREELSSGLRTLIGRTRRVLHSYRLSFTSGHTHSTSATNQLNRCFLLGFVVENHNNVNLTNQSERGGSRCQINVVFSGWFLSPVYILVFIIGLTANIIGLKSLIQNWSKQKIINVFALNLGLADILYILTLPFLVYHLKSGKWIFGEIFCKVTRFCFNMNLYGSIGFLTCISVSRYLAIVHPVRVIGRLTATHSVVVSVLVWVLVSVQCLPDMFFIKTKAKGEKKCYETTSEDFVEDYLTYSMVWTVTGFCLPFLVTVGCYTHVIVTLCGSRSTNHQLKSRSLKLLVLTKKKQCYSWFNTVYMAHQVGRGLVSLNPALNPLVYLHVREELSSGLRTFIGRTRQECLEVLFTSEEQMEREFARQISAASIRDIQVVEVSFLRRVAECSFKYNVRDYVSRLVWEIRRAVTAETQSNCIYLILIERQSS
ncbi:hypothetical protein WMY93_009619 [Mugilogobius chulae]|uniref:G-protein coupled receptors family 1 profile domain-containing protein n=1 Tax=Mugilogobius chulae TaxID=88201 RepID=A0AAW0PMY6_9GOBI